MRGQNRNLLPDGSFLLSSEEQMRRFHESIMLLGWICVPSHVTHWMYLDLAKRQFSVLGLTNFEVHVLCLIYLLVMKLVVDGLADKLVT
jgi:hypothetical protein